MQQHYSQYELLKQIRYIQVAQFMQILLNLKVEGMIIRAHHTQTHTHKHVTCEHAKTTLVHTDHTIHRLVWNVHVEGMIEHHNTRTSHTHTYNV